MSRSIYSGSTEIWLDCYIVDATSNNGLTGLTAVTAGLTCAYVNSGSAAVQIPLVATTIGTWVEGGFVEVDPVLAPGMYQLALPNAALTGGGFAFTLLFSGVSGMREYAEETQITAINLQDNIRGGLLALPNGSMMFKKNQALAAFPFLMVSKADHTTPLRGLTITSLVSINGGTPQPTLNNAVELNGDLMPGMYIINLDAADTNGNTLVYTFMNPAADTRSIAVITQP